MITLLEITEINGHRHELDYDCRKTEFEDKAELEKYRKYIEKRTGKKVYFSYRDETTQNIR